MACTRFERIKFICQALAILPRWESVKNLRHSMNLAVQVFNGLSVGLSMCIGKSIELIMGDLLTDSSLIQWGSGE